MEKLHGTRPKPRVGVVGDWSESDLVWVRTQFPTVWPESGTAPSYAKLVELVDPRELDLLLIGEQANFPSEFEGNVVAFSHLEGVNLGQGYDLVAARIKGEEHTSATHPTAIDRVTKRMLARPGFSVRGKAALSLRRFQHPLFPVREFPEVVAGAICQTPDGAHGIYFRRSKGNWLAWFPFPDRTEWIAALLPVLADSHPEAFGSVGGWSGATDWRTRDEAALANEEAQLSYEEQQAIAEFARRRTDIEARQRKAEKEAAAGVRRLLTADGEELEDAVEAALRELGFEVDPCDRLKPPGAAKREDFRIRTADRPEWEAIVEVKGYAKGGGKTADLQQIGRHAAAYEREKRKPPSAQFYICNQYFSQPPSRRGALLAGSEEDVEVFAEVDGVVMSTLDLFRLLRAGDPAEGRRRMLACRGYYTTPDE